MIRNAGPVPPAHWHGEALAQLSEGESEPSSRDILNTRVSSNVLQARERSRLQVVKETHEQRSSVRERSASKFIGEAVAKVLHGPIDVFSHFSRRSVADISIVESSGAHASGRPRPSHKRPREQSLFQLRWHLAKNVCFIFFFLMLDVQDLLYKAWWVGPAENYSFSTAVKGKLDETFLHAHNAHFTNTTWIIDDDMVSSWPIYLTSCSSLQAFDRVNMAQFFFIALGSNCTIGVARTERSVENLVMASSVRLDAIVWTACQLLFPMSRPQICQDEMVDNYISRYALTPQIINISKLSIPGSDAEHELLELLGLIWNGYPPEKMICVEAFEWRDRRKGSYTAQWIGCASPSEPRSVFVGSAAGELVGFLQDKVWLTSDVVQLAGLRFGIRQSNRNNYTHSDDAVITTPAQLNFSCFGHLYGLVLLVDSILIVVSINSSWQIVQRVVRPYHNELVGRIKNRKVHTAQVLASRRKLLDSWSGRPTTSDNSSLLVCSPELLGTDDLASLISCSIYRSLPVMLALAVSQVFSWMVMLPNSVVWYWGVSSFVKVQIYLCTLRLWVLVVITTNWAWDLVVRFDEEWAFHVASHTFATHIEVFIITAATTLCNSNEVLSMATNKWELEHQRVNDASSFEGYVAHGNTHSPALDAIFTTQPRVLWIIFGPLIKIVATSLAVVAVYLGLKWLYLARRHRGMLQTAAAMAAARPRLFYERLPLEAELDCAIRARSLLRHEFSMELMVMGMPFIRPNCYLEFGLLPFQGFVHWRVGFMGSKLNMKSVSAPPPRSAYHSQSSGRNSITPPS